MDSSLIHTPLQRGEWHAISAMNRFSGLRSCGRAVETGTVQGLHALGVTPLNPLVSTRVYESSVRSL
jgi:hypothetical protein